MGAWWKEEALDIKAEDDEDEGSVLDIKAEDDEDEGSVEIEEDHANIPAKDYMYSSLWHSYVCLRAYSKPTPGVVMVYSAVASRTYFRVRSFQ